ncbi:hypothetical protein OPV22_003614 [Ensete ventricosum]|uniref:Uncharacterized protein n=1 Tax=Ensete ventricosum TaxID=4639 RepID=A0AAV8S136_ENSVE|nr:hypothetical protein OPV22_003614 [Ensete ventricosum]
MDWKMDASLSLIDVDNHEGKGGGEESIKNRIRGGRWRRKAIRRVVIRRWAQRDGRTSRNGTRGDGRGGWAVQESRRPTAAVAVVQSETSPVRLRLLVLHGNTDTSLYFTMAMGRLTTTATGDAN